MLVTVRRGKTNPEGDARDVRFVKGDVAGAVRTLRAAVSPGPVDRVVPLSPQMVVCGSRRRPGRRRLVGERLADADVKRQRRERR